MSHPSSMVEPAPRGLHHVTCVCNDWEASRAFYEALGLSFVKNTVNHDAPETRHIYLANRQGEPGTTLTFFEWPSQRQGRPGVSSAQHVGLTLGDDLTLEQAKTRLEAQGASVNRAEHLGEPCLETKDPDGLALRLLADPGDGPSLHHAALYGAQAERAAYLEDVLGFTVTNEAPAQVQAPNGDPVLVLLGGDPGPGRIGPGAVHHVAFAVDGEEQRAIQARLRDHGATVTDVIDRVYFRSVYTRDPGGHILEFASLGPGFAEDEPEDALGETLVLPPWLEDRREAIEDALAENQRPPASA